MQEIINPNLKNNTNGINMHEDFLGLLNNIDTHGNETKVIQVLGENEIKLEEGRFYLSDVIDPSKKKNITRDQARELMQEYAIRRNRQNLGGEINYDRS